MIASQTKLRKANALRQPQKKFSDRSNYVVVILAGTRENFYDELKRVAK
ncbi:MAG: hypothetical protein FWB96_05410 [Defluviitaleaceae bacterium]|nr:hypothetical protein [Defluviitaleaceae bacterium]MCL2263023.1 hypothetical protein [Defluviitaleaceae bacterium]